MNQARWVVIILSGAMVLFTSACQKDREVFGIAQHVDPAFTVRIVGLIPRVAVGQDQRISVESRLGSKCSAQLTYRGASGGVPSDIDKADVGPETTPGSGVGVADLTWQVRAATQPQLVTAVVTCFSGSNSSVPAETSFEVVPAPPD